MPKSKEKPDSRRPIRFLTYAVLWMISMGLATVISRVFLALDMTRFLTVEQVVMIQLGLGGFLVALAQARLTERLLKRSMRGWVVYSMIGTLILLFFLLNPYLFNPNFRASVTLRSLILMLSVPLLQALWLRQHVYRAWLWPLAQCMALIGSTLLLRRLDTDSFVPMLLTRLFGLMCGVLMIYLWSHPKEAEKTKVDFAADETYDQTRIERLQEREPEQRNPLWNMGDEQTLQSEA